MTRKYVVPHTEEWFNFLHKRNPMQAKHTEHMIETAGSLEICSVCGEPADTDYFIKNAPKKDKKYATMKLCDDCCLIRRMTMDEKLIKID